MGNEQIVLGLDIGVASVGWALVRFTQSAPGGTFDRPVGLVATGVRRFETGTDGKKAGEAGITQGRDESRAKSRRVARGQRRQTHRRSQRIANTLRHLQAGSLLPAGQSGRGDSRHNFIHDLDTQLLPLMLRRVLRREPSLDAQTAAQIVATRFPYLLRAAALVEPLAPYELGRLFLHLAQRRGYQSNRKEASKLKIAEQEQLENGTAKKKSKRPDEPGDPDDAKGTLAGIESLRRRMHLSGAPTLGAYLATLDPHKDRIRTLRTHRDMFTHEFDMIVAKQMPYHPVLSDSVFIRRLRHALFFQRPLRSARALRNRCELMPPRRCVAKASLIFQRYRMVTEVNNNLGEVLEATGEIRPISQSERNKVYKALTTSPRLTLPQARIEAGLPKGARWKLELDKDFSSNKRLPGESLAIALAAAAPEWWEKATASQREALVASMRGAQSDDELVRLLQGPAWRIDVETARAIATIPMEDGYGSYSRAAIEKLLPHLEQGWTLAASIKEEFKQTKTLDPLDLLPPVKGQDRASDEKQAIAVDPHALGDIRNPAVMRSLTELRKVVNGIVRKHGKPDLIRVELARDLKRGRQERKAIYRNNLERESKYDKYEADAKESVPSLGAAPLSRRDRLKWALAVECGWECPYTGTVFEPHDLFGGGVHIEHIIPRSQHGEDGFGNLTLCMDTENDLKGGRTPYEAYGIPDPNRYLKILQRVGRFKGSGAAVKLAAFQRRDTADEEFAMRHLNDTRYITRLAVRYLGFLYGYVDDPTRARAIDAQGKLRVQSNTGGLTSLLRRKWQLMRVMDKLLRSQPGAPTLPVDLSAAQREEFNKRVDHRHHAIDAIVVALTTPTLIEQLANIAREAEMKRLPHDRLPPIPDPWAGFGEDVEVALKQIVVSQRPDYRINGPLHKATNFSGPIPDKSGTPRTHERYYIDEVHPSKIADATLREYVITELGGRDPKDAFDHIRRETLPVFGKGLGAHPVRRVRTTAFDKADHLKKVGAGFVQEGSNNHMVIFERVGPPGGARGRKNPKKIDWVPCSTFEAMSRLRRNEPVVQAPAGCRFIGVIRRGDYFELSDNAGARGLYIVENLSENDVQLRLPHLLPDNKARGFPSGRPRFKSVGAWLNANPRKMKVSPLGEVSESPEAMQNE